MEKLPIEFIGKRNFPDIAVERIDMEENQVRVLGEMLIESTIDHTLVDGFSELLVVSSSDNKKVESFKKSEQDWEPTLLDGLKTIYLIFCEDDGTVTLEGYSLDSKPTRVSTPNASIYHKYTHSSG